MVLERPTKAEKKRFDELQKQGLLPSEALKKIETERRLGITPEIETKLPLGLTKENWWFYTALGTLFIGYLYIRLKQPTTQSGGSLNLNKTNNSDYLYIST